MKLIDVDTLIEDLEYDIELDARALDDTDLLLGRDRELIQFDKDCKQNAIDMLKNESAVNAIPISFIQDRINSLQELAEYEFEANGGYIGQVSFEKNALKDLLEEWEKANANK